MTQWCRRAFQEKEARLRDFYEGKQTFAGNVTGHDSGEADEAERDLREAHSRRSGRMAVTFFASLLLLVLLYGGTIFGLYAVFACCVHTLVTAAGGWDTLEVQAMRFSETLKQD